MFYRRLKKLMEDMKDIFLKKKNQTERLGLTMTGFDI